MSKRTKSLSARLLAQRQADIDRKRHKASRAAARAVRVSERDKGRILFISPEGKKRVPPDGKGFYVYVTKTSGKVRRILNPGGRPPAARRRVDVDLPEGWLSRKVRDVRAREQSRDAGGDVMVWGRGRVKSDRSMAMGPGSKFSKKLVADLAKAFKKRGQSRREFLVKVKWFIKGKKEPYEASLQISRADHVEIKKSGLAGWVHQKALGALGRMMMLDGLITPGSRNHIRRTSEDDEEFDGEYFDSHGNVVDLDDLTVATVEGAEWSIEQF